MIRVILPAHLRTLAKVEGEILLDMPQSVTLKRVIDALENKFPPLRGTIRDQLKPKRRPFLRFFACEEDISDIPWDIPLPQAIVSGQEPFLVIGSVAGG